jgi:hypothetical protein
LIGIFIKKLFTMVDQPLRRSHRQHGLSSKVEDQPTVNKILVSTGDDVDPLDLERDYEESECVDIELVDKIPPPNFIPPLTSPFYHVLLRVRGQFSEPF